MAGTLSKMETANGALSEFRTIARIRGGKSCQTFGMGRGEEEGAGAKTEECLSDPCPPCARRSRVILWEAIQFIVWRVNSASEANECDTKANVDVTPMLPCGQANGGSLWG